MKKPSAHFLTTAVITSLIFSGDITLRLIEDHLSPNIAHVNQIPTIAQKFIINDNHSLLFVGNSLTNNGVDIDVLRSLDGPLDNYYTAVEKVVPDSTTIWSWSCILEGHFLTTERAPATVVIGFAWSQLSDQSRRSPTGLGAFFCSTRDLVKLNIVKRMTSTETGEYLTAKFFRLYAHRETIRNRFLAELVPYYQSITQQMNRQTRQTEETEAGMPLTYELLKRLKSRMDSTNTRLIVVAMPVRDEAYEIDNKLIDTLNYEGIPLFDYRVITGIAPKDFLDEMHLNENGAAVLTRSIAADLEKALSQYKAGEHLSDAI